MDQRARLEEEKTARIEEARAARQRAAGVQMGADISAEEERLRNVQDAEAINKQFGSSMSAEDAAALRGNEAARSAYGLLAPTRQSDLERRAAAAENLGYLDAARESRSQLSTEVQNQRYDEQTKTAERRLDEEVAWRKDQAKRAERREDRMDRMAEAQLAFTKSRAGKEDARAEQMAEREQRAATAAALRGAETDVKQLQKDLADPLLDPAQKEALQRDLTTARADARRFRQALAGAGLEGSGAPSKPFNPDDFRIGGSQPEAQREPSGQRSAAPAARAPAPSERLTPAQQAVRGLDLAIQNTVRALTQASNRGDRAEAERLNNLLQEQQAAKARVNQ